MKIALLTGGGDKPYAVGLLTALVSRGITVDFIGSDEFLNTEILSHPNVRFLNLRRDQNPSVTLPRKIVRVFLYYCRLFRYATTSECTIFHILWANRFLLLDRVALILYLKLCNKKLAFTAHNINEKERDGGDSALNRITLRFLYSSVDHIFVHTSRMKQQLVAQFDVLADDISVIPFGVNNTLPRSGLARSEAKLRLRLADQDRVVLFFGNIASYKGLEYAVHAVNRLERANFPCRLLIAGQVKASQPYWNHVSQLIDELALSEQVIRNIRYIPDEDVEQYFLAADVLVLPYKFIYQSGVLFLSYSFGLPVIATDVGTLADDIIPGKTGFVCRPADSDALADAIETYFNSDLFRNLEGNRPLIIDFANEHYSWETVGAITHSVYARLLEHR